MKLDMERDARNFLEDLKTSGKQYIQVAVKVLSLMENPKPNDSEAMKGHPYYRVDVGEFRIIYEIGDDTVNIIIIGKRNGDEIYKKLKRKE